MLYLGIDCHKNRSYVTAMDKDGQVKFSGALLNDKESFRKLVLDLNDSCTAVIETGYTWGVVYDILEDLGVKVKLAHAYKLRAIAESQIKTDKRDSVMLANLLRANMIPEVFVPPRAERRKKNILRERSYLVKNRTAIKNRMHQLLARNHIVVTGYSDIFGKAGRKYLDTLNPAETEKELLNTELDVLDKLNEKIRCMEKLSKKELSDNVYVKLIKTMPGFGDVLSKIVALEISDINRFQNAKKLVSYAGLIPREYSSGDKTFRGPIVKSANNYLKWAFVEAAWPAIKTSHFFKNIYINVKSRRGSNKAIVAVARHMCEIIYRMLKENRPYEDRFYKIKKEKTALL